MALGSARATILLCEFCGSTKSRRAFVEEQSRSLSSGLLGHDFVFPVESSTHVRRCGFQNKTHSFSHMFLLLRSSS